MAWVVGNVSGVDGRLEWVVLDERVQGRGHDHSRPPHGPGLWAGERLKFVDDMSSERTKGLESGTAGDVRRIVEEGFNLIKGDNGIHCDGFLVSMTVGGAVFSQ